MHLKDLPLEQRARLYLDVAEASRLMWGVNGELLRIDELKEWAGSSGEAVTALWKVLDVLQADPELSENVEQLEARSSVDARDGVELAHP